MTSIITLVNVGANITSAGIANVTSTIEPTDGIAATCIDIAVIITVSTFIDICAIDTVAIITIVTAAVKASDCVGTAGIDIAITSNKLACAFVNVVASFTIFVKA